MDATRGAYKVVTASEIGLRRENQDSVAAAFLRSRGTAIAICCDGIGSLPDAGDCARAACRSALHRLRRYLAEYCLKRSIKEADAGALRHRLSTLALKGIPPQSGTTIALGVMQGKRVIVAWAGDSRVYVVQNDGCLRQLTADDHDASGSITNFVLGTGAVELRTCYTLFSVPPVAMFATSDGVHESCTIDELRRFVLHCVEAGIVDNARFRKKLEEFLGQNISDNYSMVLWYRALSPKVLQSFASCTTW